MINLNCKKCNINVLETGLKWSKVNDGWFCKKCIEKSDANYINDVLRNEFFEKNLGTKSG
jgi:hypothetical protein